MKNGLKQFPESELISYVNGTGSAISSGAFVQFGGILGVAQADIADGATGTIHTRGRFEAPKTAGASTAIAAGTRGTLVSGAFVASPGGPLLVTKAAVDADTVVEVNLDPLPFGSRRVTVSTDQAAANSTNGQVDIVTGLAAAPSAVFVTVRTVTTGRVKSTYDIDLSVAGTITVKGVGSGTQLDVGDIVDVLWVP